MTLKLESSKCQDHHLRRSSPTSTATNLRPPASHQRLPLLLPVPPRAIGFDLLGGAGGRDSNGEDDFEGGRGFSSSSQQSPRELLVAAGRLILHREILAENSSSSVEGSPAAAALALLRAVASPGGRNDGAASSAGAALAAALVSRPSGSRGGWKGFLLDEIVVGRNNPLARSVARGGAWGERAGGAGGGEGGDSGDSGEEEAAAASAAGAALAADLAALQSLAFGGAAAASWVRGADPSAPRAWLDAFAAAVDGGGEEEKPARQKEEEGGGGGESASATPSPRLLPPLTRGQRAAAARALSSRARWADGAPELIALWSRHGAGNVGSYFAFEWNSSSPSLIVPTAEDRGGGMTAAESSKLLVGGGGAAAALWDPVAQRLAAWARGDRLAPFDAGCFAARLEVPPSSLAERGRGSGDESDDGEKKKKKKEKKKEQGGSFSSSSSASPCPSLSLWDGLRTSPVLLASGARLVRLPAVSSSSSSSSQTLPLRSLWRALRLHPRARWVVVSDSFPAGGGGGEAALAMEGELPPGVALAVRKR